MARATKLQQGKNGKLASKKSKTGDVRCSQAASAFARGQATSDTYKILGECRSRARMKGQANLQREAGNEAKAQVLDKRADRGLTGAQRVAKAKELIAARKAKIDARVQAKAAPAVQAKPSLREQADAARAAKGDRASRLESLRMKAYDAKRKHSNAALNAGRNQSQYLQKAAKARTAGSKADWQGMAGTQARVADREFDRVGRMQRWTDRLDAAQRPQKPAIDRRADVMARLEKRRAAIQSPEGQAKIAAQRQRAAERDATSRPLFGAKAAPAKPDRLARLGATDPKVKAMLAERRSARAAELRQQRAAKAAPAPATARPSRSTPERQARVEAAKDRLFGRRLDRAFTKLEGPKGDNFQGLDKVRAALPYRAQEFESRLTAQRKQGRYSLASYEGTAGPMSDSLRAASIKNGTSILSYVSRRDAEPHTPRKAKATPAAPSLLEQARKAREAKGTREQRIAAIAKRADKIGTPLLRKEQDLTKSFEGYTKAMSRYQSELPWASKNDKGYASEIEKSLAMLRSSVQQTAAKSAKVSARVKSLRNRVSPLLAKSAR